MRLNSLFAAVGAGSKSLQADNARQRAEQRAVEQVERQRKLEDVLAQRQAEQHAASMQSRTLEDALTRAQIEAAQNPRPKEDWQVDAERGVRIERNSGRVEPLQGMPKPAPKPMTEAQVAARESRRLDRTRDLRTDYEKSPAVKSGHELARVAGGIQAGLSGQSPMDDLSLIYETVKLFDPQSVVREGEIKLFQSAASLPLQLRLTVERWNSGRLLTPGMRAHIATLVDRKVAESKAAVAPVQSDFGKMARNYGVEADSAFIAPDPFRGVRSSKRSSLPNP